MPAPGWRGRWRVRRAVSAAGCWAGAGSCRCCQGTARPTCAGLWSRGDFCRSPQGREHPCVTTAKCLFIGRNPRFGDRPPGSKAGSCILLPRLSPPGAETCQRLSLGGDRTGEMGVGGRQGRTLACGTCRGCLGSPCVWGQPIIPAGLLGSDGSLCPQPAAPLRRTVTQASASTARARMMTSGGSSSAAT